VFLHTLEYAVENFSLSDLKWPELTIARLAMSIFMNDSLNETSFQKPEEKLYFIKIGSRVKKLLKAKQIFFTNGLAVEIFYNFRFKISFLRLKNKFLV